MFTLDPGPIPAHAIQDTLFRVATVMRLIIFWLIMVDAIRIVSMMDLVLLTALVIPDIA